VLTGPAPDGWMQRVAAELNLSETAFLFQECASYKIRYFTPQVEVPLCGHATLASAHVLWSVGLVSENMPIKFQAENVLLFAEKAGDWIRMDFPADPSVPIQTPPGLLSSLNVEPVSVYRTASNRYLIEVGSWEAVRDLRPDRFSIATLDIHGVIVTAHSAKPGIDFVSRYFAPSVGIDEDPVTGTAHCALGMFWSQRLGKKRLVGEQLSARGGTVMVRVMRDRIQISGQAVTVLIGEFSPQVMAALER